MMVIRPVKWEDKTALLELAQTTGFGFTSLPHDEDRMVHRLERMLATWDKSAPLSDQGYMFVLEDTEQQKVVGVCGIEVALGLNEPWYAYRLGTLVHASKELDVYTQMPTLFLSNDHTGYSELCTLFLHSDYRHSYNGQLLSKSRLLFIASFQECFAEKIIAEMRGVSDEHGHSPFWESLGRHFFAIDFEKADHLTGIGQKSFIAELMPKHPLYVDFLTEEAREVIAQVHPSTAPARRILESEGMRYEGYVDIFDAGPTLEAYIKDLRVVKESQTRTVKIVGDQSTETHTYLISNTHYEDFRSLIGTPIVDEHFIQLTHDQAKALHLDDGEQARVVSLFAKQPEV
jgi:arginine N-succinyltransferase